MALDIKSKVFADKQRLMRWRRDAHYFDFSKEVGEKIADFSKEKLTGVLRADEDEKHIPAARRFWDVPFFYPSSCVHLTFDSSVYTKHFMTDAVNSPEYSFDQYQLFVVDKELHVYIAGDRNELGRFKLFVDLEELHTGTLEKSFILYPESQGSSYEIRKNNSQAMIRFCMLVHTAFEFIAETKAVTVEREQIPYPWAGKNREFYTKTTIVKIAMSKVRNKYLKRSEPTGRKMPWGEVRSHFAHWRVTDPNCEHQWHDRTGEGRKFKCDKCGEIKTLRTFPHGRGNKEIGIIKTNYEVSST